MKSHHHSLGPPKFSTSLSEGSLAKSPQLPPTTPSSGTNGRANPYTSLLEPQLQESQSKKVKSLANVEPPPNSAMHAIYKMIAKLPFEVRERVTSIVNMAIFTADNVQKQYEGLRIELLTLKNQHKKKLVECDHLNQRCEIFREQIVKLEEKLGALQDDAESRQTYAIRNSKAISRLSSTNKTLIDAFALINDGGSNNKTITHRQSQRRKNNLAVEIGSPSRTSSPEERIVSQPVSPAVMRKPSNPNPAATGHAHSDLEVSVTKNEKLRERLLRVAKDYNRVVKNVENLESKIQGLRSSLRYAERRNRQLQLELDELRENQSLENSSTVKNPTDGDANDRRGNSGSSKHMKDRMDTRLSVLVNRNAFDPMDGIKYMDSMIAHLASTPCNLVEEDIARHLCSRNACNLFDAEKIAIFILQPGGTYMHRYVTSSTRTDRIKLGERESISENIIRHGLIRRYNNLKQSKNLYFNPDIDACGDISLKRILSVPMREMGQGRVIGVFQLLNKRDSNKFSEVDELYAAAYGEMCGGLVSGSILYRRVWNESSIISGLIQSPYRLLDAVPQKDTLCSAAPLSIIDVLYTLEHVLRDALKCSKTKAFIVSSDEDVLYSLEQEAITMMTLKLSQLSLKKSPKHSGVTGHVATTRKPYLVLQSSFDPWLNPEVDMNCPEQPFYCVPILDFHNEVIACIQLSPSPLSPNINSIQEKIEPLALSFERAADWLAYCLASNLANILKYIGKPSSRPELKLSPITLTEKLATMPLSLNPINPEPVRKRRPTLVKSVTMAEESSRLPGGGLYENGFHHKSNRDEDLKDFLLQFPDYEQSSAHSHQTTSHGRTNSEPTTTLSNAVESLDSQRSSLNSVPSTSVPQVAPSLPPSEDKGAVEIEKVKQKYEKDLGGVKAELYFLKENAKLERQKLMSELTEVKEQLRQNTLGNSEIKILEDKYNTNLKDYRHQFEQDLHQMRANHNEEKTILKKNIQQLEENIKNLQSKLAFVDKPIDTKNLDIVGYLEVSRLSVSQMTGFSTTSPHPPEITFQIKLGDGSNWSHAGEPTPYINGKLLWEKLNFQGRVSQAQIPVDALSIRIKEKNDGSMKLIGVANISISSLLNQLNAWITLTGSIVDREGKPSSGKYSIRVRYRREDQEPIPDSEDETPIKQSKVIQGPLGYLEAREIAFQELPLIGMKFFSFSSPYLYVARKNLFAEISINTRDFESTQMTDIQKAIQDSIQWKNLILIGKCPQVSLESSRVNLILKEQQLPTDISLYRIESELDQIIGKFNQWITLTGNLLDKDGNTSGGHYSIQIRYRQEGQDPSAGNEEVNVKEIQTLNPDSLKQVELPQRSREASSPPPVDQDSEPIDEIQDPLPNQLSDEVPPPTPKQEEVSKSPRFGDWALMTDQEGTPYYYHTITGETSWNPPCDPQDPLDVVSDQIRNGDWIQLQDDGGNFYWYNEITGQSAWDIPIEEPEVYSMPHSENHSYASASAGGYTIEL